jgi:putative oxidoreductase
MRSRDATRVSVAVEVAMRSLGLLILRLAAGTVLIAHGYVKLFGGHHHRVPRFLARFYGPEFSEAAQKTGPEGFGDMLEQLEVPAPQAAAYVSGLAEFGGGIGVLLGLRTRLAAPIVIANMATAIRTVHWKNGLYGRKGFEFPLTLAAIAGSLFFTGPGSISLDALLDSDDKHAAPDRARDAARESEHLAVAA